MEIIFIIFVSAFILYKLYSKGMGTYKENIIDILNDAVSNPKEFWGDDYENYLNFKKREPIDGENYNLASLFIRDQIVMKLRKKGFSDKDISVMVEKEETRNILIRGTIFIYDNHYLNINGELGVYGRGRNLDPDMRVSFKPPPRFIE